MNDSIKVILSESSNVYEPFQGRNYTVGELASLRIYSVIDKMLWKDEISNSQAQALKKYIFREDENV